jgi:hypothetical protein
MARDYVIWTSGRINNYVVLETLHGVDKLYEVKRGIPRAASFPADARYTMHPDWPTNTVLTDNLINTDALVVASARLADFLRARGVTHTEYLPVTILNHKKRPTGKDYFIVNPVEPVDCLDVAKSGVTWSLFDGTIVDSVQRLVLDPKRCDPDRELFRIAKFADVTLVSRELAKAMDAQGFTGNRWLELSAYPEG